MKHILLIDDNEIDNYINKLIVTKSKKADLITIMNSGLDAIEYLTNLINIEQPFPEVIFLDIHMPEMDGFEFLEEYAKFPEKAKEKSSINMLTSSNNPDDIKRANDSQYVNYYFDKPLTVEILAKM